jgi:hypothetical protein
VTFNLLEKVSENFHQSGNRWIVTTHTLVVTFRGSQTFSFSYPLKHLKSSLKVEAREELLFLSLETLEISPH